MDIDFDAEAWFGSPAPEEMLRQHLSLVEIENDLLRSEVERYRVNQAKLILLLSEANDERDMLRRDVESQSNKLSSMYADTANLRAQISTLALQLEPTTGASSHKI